MNGLRGRVAGAKPALCSKRRQGYHRGHCSRRPQNHGDNLQNGPRFPSQKCEQCRTLDFNRDLPDTFHTLFYCCCSASQTGAAIESRQSSGGSPVNPSGKSCGDHRKQKRRRFRGNRQARGEGFQRHEVPDDRAIPWRPFSDRGWHSGRSDNVLLRSHGWWCVEVDRWCDDVVAGFRQRRHVGDRQYRGVCLESQCALCRDRRGLHPWEYLARRWRLQNTRRRQDVEEHRACGIRGRSAR